MKLTFLGLCALVCLLGVSANEQECRDSIYPTAFDAAATALSKSDLVGKCAEKVSGALAMDFDAFIDAASTVLGDTDGSEIMTQLEIAAAAEPKCDIPGFLEVESTAPHAKTPAANVLSPMASPQARFKSSRHKAKATIVRPLAAFDFVFFTWNQENAAQAAINTDIPFVVNVDNVVPGAAATPLGAAFDVGAGPIGAVRTTNPALLVFCEQEARRGNTYAAQAALVHINANAPNQYVYNAAFSSNSKGWTKGSKNAIKLSFLVRADWAAGGGGAYEFNVEEQPAAYRKGYWDGKGGIVTQLSIGPAGGPAGFHAFGCAHIDKSTIAEQTAEQLGIHNIFAGLGQPSTSGFVAGDLNYRMHHVFPAPGVPVQLIAGPATWTKTNFAINVLQDRAMMHAMNNGAASGGVSFAGIVVDSTFESPFVVAHGFTCNVPGSAGAGTMYGPTYARKVGAAECANYDNAIAAGAVPTLPDTTQCFFEKAPADPVMAAPTKDREVGYVIGGTPVMKNHGWLDHVCYRLNPAKAGLVVQGYDRNCPGAIASDHMPIKVKYTVTPDW